MGFACGTGAGLATMKPTREARATANVNLIFIEELSTNERLVNAWAMVDFAGTKTKDDDKFKEEALTFLVLKWPLGNYQPSRVSLSVAMVAMCSTGRPIFSVHG